MKNEESAKKNAEMGVGGEGRSFGGKAFPYEDLLDLPRPVSKKHPPMSLYDRAAQFSSFAALTGHGEAISRTAALVEERVALEVEREGEEYV